MPDTAEPGAAFRVVLQLEDKIPGDVLFGLLDDIDRNSSISKAASGVGVSYRYAWGVLKRAEELLGESLVRKEVGGPGGGGTYLTPKGKRLLRQYRNYKAAVDGLTARAFGAGRVSEHEDQDRVQQVIVASTFELIETGLLGVLEELFFRETGIPVRHIATGSGAGLDLARMGRVDAVLSHAPALEAGLLAAGVAAERRPFLRNDFVLLGPRRTEERLSARTGGKRAGPVEAFRLIAQLELPFLSRGDKSGTHLKELELWELAGAAHSGQWYQICRACGTGNAAILQKAASLGACTLADRATWIIVSGSCAGQGLVSLCEHDEVLKNTFSMVLLHKDRFPSANHDGAGKFADWLISDSVSRLIGEFGREKYGMALFAPVN